MPDYAAILAVAQRLIGAAGKPLTLHKRAAAPADPTKPWRGPGNAADTVLSVTGVFGKGVQSDSTGESTKRGVQKVLVAPTANGDDLTTFTELNDGSLTWEITEVDSVSPGSVVVLWKLTVKR